MNICVPGTIHDGPAQIGDLHPQLVDVGNQLVNVGDGGCGTGPPMQDAERGQKPEKPYWPEHRERHDRRLIKMAKKPRHPLRGEYKTDDVVDGEDEPDDLKDRPRPAGWARAAEDLPTVGRQVRQRGEHDRPLCRLLPAFQRHACRQVVDVSNAKPMSVQEDTCPLPETGSAVVEAQGGRQQTHSRRGCSRRYVLDLGRPALRAADRRQGGLLHCRCCAPPHALPRRAGRGGCAPVITT